MRRSIPLLSLLVATGVAAADATPAQRVPATAPVKVPPKTPATNLAPVVLADLPEQCHAIAKQAVGAASLQTALSARISLAACLADVGLAPLKLCDCEESILAIDDATKRSIELLDEVITATRDPAMKITAHRAKAELYTNVIVRMTATIPPPGATEASIALHEARRTILDGMLGRWRTAAAASYEQILALAKANPKLERDPAIATAVRIAKDRLRMQVAVAPPAQPAREPERPTPEPEDDAAERDEPASDTDGDTLR